MEEGNSQTHVITAGLGFVPHLVDFVPFWVEALLDRLALEQLVTELQHAVRVRLSLDEAPQELILPFQVQSLQEVDPQDPLQSPSRHEFEQNLTKDKNGTGRH